MDLIKVEDISYSFKEYDEEGNVTGARTAVDHLSITVPAGTFLAVLGRNGSGKSTFAKHLNALLIPQEGTVYVDGIDTSKAKDMLLIRRNVGMVFQNPDNQIVSTVIEEDVAFGPENLGVPHGELEDRVYGSLEKVGMSEYASNSPTKLSGGQKQRIAIAGVLAMKPKAIVFDEATAMLDPKGRREVMAALKKLHEEGITIIHITHHMEEASEAERVIIINDGRVVMDGTPQEVFGNHAEAEKYGLRAPNAVLLRDMLKDGGMQLGEHIALDEEELAMQIASHLRGGEDD